MLRDPRDPKERHKKEHDIYGTVNPIFTVTESSLKKRNGNGKANLLE